MRLLLIRKRGPRSTHGSLWVKRCLVWLLMIVPSAISSSVQFRVAMLPSRIGSPRGASACASALASSEGACETPLQKGRCRSLRDAKIANFVMGHGGPTARGADHRLDHVTLKPSCRRPWTCGSPEWNSISSDGSLRFS